MEPIRLDLTDTAALVRAVEEHRRADIASTTRLEGGEVDEAVGLLRFVSGHAVWWTNGVLGSSLPAGHADEGIAWALDPFRERGLPAGWWMGPAPRPSDLGRRLEAQGLRRHEDLPWLAKDLRGLGDAAEIPGLVIERVEDRPGHDRWLAAMAGGFDLSPAVSRIISDRALRSGFGREGPWIRFVGMLGAEPAASAGLIVAGGGASIHNVSTAPRFRLRGIGAAMTMAALREAVRLGHRVALLSTTAVAGGLYRRIGFRHVCTVSAFLYEP